MPETTPEVEAAETEATNLPVLSSLVAAWVEPPLLIEVSRLHHFAASIRDFIHSHHYRRLQEEDVEALGQDDFWPQPQSWRARYRPYNVTDGVLHVPIRGPITYRYGEQVGRYLTGDEYIRRAVMRGLADEQVRGIMLDIDSPGSSARGIFELTDFVREAGETKPIRAFAHSAFSGAYSLATAARSVTVQPSGHTGSVGVVSTHVDLSKMFSEIGVKHTFIVSGKHKVDGNPYQPLSASTRKDWQNDSDKIYDKFVSRVAEHRGLSEEEVRDTEARVFDAMDSVEVGFADSIGTFDEGLTSFMHDVGSNQSTRGFAMTKETQDNGLTQADVDKATTEARTEARTEERKRWASVLDSEHYGGREALARQLLDTSDLSSEQVVGALEKSPKAEAEPPKPAGTAGTAQPKDHFAERMAAEGGAGAGTETPADDKAKTPAERANGLFVMAGYRPASANPASAK